MISPTMLLSSLLADVGRLDPRSQGLERDIQTLKDRFEHEGIGFVTVALGRFADHFDMWLARRSAAPVPGFRNKPRSPFPAFLSGLVSNVFDEVTGLLKEDYCLSTIKSVRQILRFFKKALISENEEKLHKLEKESFYEKERVEAQVDDSLLIRLRHAGYYILNGLDSDIESIFTSCRHGPGAVAERCTGNQKWKVLSEQVEEFDLFPESQAHGAFEPGMP